MIIDVTFLTNEENEMNRAIYSKPTHPAADYVRDMKYLKREWNDDPIAKYRKARQRRSNWPVVAVVLGSVAIGMTAGTVIYGQIHSANAARLEEMK